MTYTKNYLVHHGILGQKWGSRNGPPYPLSSSDHSASERKAGWRKSLDKKSDTSDSSKSKGLTDKQKRIAKNVAIGAGITVGALLLAYGGYKLHQNQRSRRIRNVSDAGASVIDDILSKDVGNDTPFEKLISGVNPQHYTDNCKETSYEACKRILGYKNAVAGARTVDGSLYDFMESKIEGGGYKYVKQINANSSTAYNRVCKQILKNCKDGDCGIVCLGWAREFIKPEKYAEYDATDGVGFGHAFLFRVDKDTVIFGDAQPDPPLLDLGDRYFRMMNPDKEIEWATITKELVDAIEKS